MVIVRATKRLLGRLGPITAGTADESTTLLGDWYATALFWRPQVVLLVSEATLLPVLMPLAPAASVLARFPGQLATVLAAHDVPEAVIAVEADQMREPRVAATTSRSVVGSMTEFARLADASREPDQPVDLIDLSVELATFPCGPLYRRHVSPRPRARRPDPLEDLDEPPLQSVRNARPWWTRGRHHRLLAARRTACPRVRHASSRSGDGLGGGHGRGVEAQRHGDFYDAAHVGGLELCLVSVDGEGLRRARTAAGLSQDQVARRLGIRVSTVSHWERGLNEPRPVMIPQLARLYGVGPAQLLGMDRGAPTIVGLRLACGMTMAEVAGAIGVGVMTYRRIELGQGREPDDRIWAALGQLFDTPPDTVRQAFGRR